MKMDGAGTGSALAADRSVYVAGCARFSVLTERIELRYPGAGKGFSRNNLTASFRLGEGRGAWHYGMRDRANLKGAKRTLDAHHGAYFFFKKENRWHKAEVEPGFLSRDGWVAHDDTRTIPLETQSGVPWCTAREEGDGVRRDLYLIAYGHDYRAALGDMAHVFGAQPLPPRFTLGYWWSRWWSYTDKELEEPVDSFDAARLPLDVLVIDMDWHKPGWTGYTWDEDLFPDHRAFLRRMKQRGLKVALNLHPADGVKRHEAAFPAMARALGMDPAAAQDIPFDCTSRAYGEPYGSLMCECVRQRYAAVPYIYTENWKATRTGVSLCRPLYYDRPEEWIDIAQGSALDGGRWVTRRYTLRETPVFVRPGAIVPGQGEVSRLRAGGYRDLTLTVYPGGNNVYELYEDDGVSRDHQDGGYVKVTIRHVASYRQAHCLLTCTGLQHEENKR